MTGDQAAILDLVLERAPKLRAAGVLSVAIDGLSVTLAPPEPPPDMGSPEDEPSEVDVLSDPATYGRRSGVPGRKRERR